MELKNKDQPVCPHTEKVGDVSVSEGGLTKREHAAIEIMASLAANPDHFEDDWETLARCAVQWADILFEVLDK